MRAPCRTVGFGWLLLLVLNGCDATGSIRVTVRGADAAGTPIGGAQVQLVGTTRGAVTSSQGVALISKVPAGSYKVMARWIGTCPSIRPVDVVNGAQAAVTIWMCTDVVHADNAAAEKLIVALDLHTNTAGTTTCEQDLLIEGVGTAKLPVNALALSAASPPCHGGVAVFSTGRAFHYTSDATAVPWTATLGDVHSVQLASRPLRVPIRFHISDKSLSPADIALLKAKIHDLHFTQANQLLRDGGAGIELVASEADGGTPEIVDISGLPDAPLDALGLGCDAVHAIRSAPSIYEQGRLNVYYVASIGEPLTGIAAGQACVEEGAANIIFMDHDANSHYTLSHEIGHALGLTRPAWGHTNQLAGFYADPAGDPLNIMASAALAPSYFSLGQAARMNLNGASWLNAISGSGNSTVRSRQTEISAPGVVSACGCPDTDVKPDCPALALDIPRAGVVQGGPPFLLACAVVAPASVTVTCPVPKTVTVDFKQGAATAFAEGKWVSLDPSIVQVVLSAEAPGKMTGTLTGVAPGTATVHAYAGGSFSPIAVTVSGACSPP